MDSFAGGSFRDRVRSAEAAAAAAPSIQEQITVRQSKESGSHSAGFEAWMRGRGTGGVQVFTADDVIDQFGVVKGSYDAVPLPRIRAHVVRCSGPGRAAEVLSLGAEDLPAELEWGQVLVSVRYAPINPADLYTVATGGTYGQESVKPPFVPGHDAVGVVVKVREGGEGMRWWWWCRIVGLLLNESWIRMSVCASVGCGNLKDTMHPLHAHPSCVSSAPYQYLQPLHPRRAPGSSTCTRTTGSSRCAPSLARGARCW